MNAISHRILRAGVLNLPGALPSTKSVAEDVLFKDAQQFHCFFRAAGLHNHLSHHILAAYDLGAPSSLLQKIYDDEASYQRPIFLDSEKNEEIQISENNWDQHLGNQNAYGGYYQFFKDRIASAGIEQTLDAYIFDSASHPKGANMLSRLVAGAVHPLIQVGYGLEFSIDTLVASGLAQASVHTARKPELYDPQPSSGSSQSIFDVLAMFYNSDVLVPAQPYDPNALIGQRQASALEGGRMEELRRIVATLPSAFDVNQAAEQAIWAATLLLFATGRPGREPRLDFFLMHLVTSSLFLKPYLRVIQNKHHQETLIRAWLLSALTIVEARGRPVIRPELVMAASSVPRPPVSSTGIGADKASIGNPLADEDYNPWPAMIQSVLHAPDCHVPKTMRTLIMAARDFGPNGPGVLGNALPGLDGIDGTLFVKTAGMLLDYMGWTGHGQKAREDWDRSALGWDEAWE